MSLSEHIRLALNNVFRAGTKTILCVLAICIGIASVSTIVSLGVTAGESVQTELDHIGVRGVAFYTKTGETFGEAAAQALAQTQGITVSMPLVLTSGGVRLRNQTAIAGILGIDERLDQVFQVTVLHGRLPTRGQVVSGAKIAVVDEAFAEKAYMRTNIVGKTLWITVNGVTEKLEICAVIRSQSAGIASMIGGNVPHLIYLPYTTLTALSSDLKTDKIIAIPETPEAEALSDGLVQKLERLTGVCYQYENLNQYLDSISGITTIFTLLTGGVAAISVVVGGLGVMNTMIASIDARTRDIGIYRALGAKRRDIIRMFLMESIILCLIGGLAGIALTGSLFLLARTLLSYPIGMQTEGILLSIGMSLFCGLSFGWIPAVRAANLDPIRAIRSE